MVRGSGNGDSSSAGGSSYGGGSRMIGGSDSGRCKPLPLMSAAVATQHQRILGSSSGTVGDWNI